jgi:hypothetical protein
MSEKLEVRTPSWETEQVDWNGNLAFSQVSPVPSGRALRLGHDRFFFSKYFPAHYSKTSSYSKL